MKNILPANLVRQSLAGHSWLGLLSGVLLYLVCLSGVPVVFMHELGRWEQPAVEQHQAYVPTVLGPAYQQFTADHPEYSGTVSFALPSPDLPRVTISTDQHSWLLDATGQVTEQIHQPFTEMLIGLHVNLHIPRNIGVIIVAVLGVMICALALSGIFAHPRIFRDAFKLRLGRKGHLQEADLHNRLSVWNLPFLLLIGISGAFFGVYNFVLLSLGTLHYDGNFREILGTIYGTDPAVQHVQQLPDFQRALHELSVIAPEARPFDISVMQRNSENQYLLITAKHPQRLIYGEEYYFNSDGSYLHKQGFSDGPKARQLLFSIHSLHLGDFGGLAIKLLYAVLGLAMAVITASGINIWLLRRGKKVIYRQLWSGIVWGTPLAISGGALLAIGIDASASISFWIILLAALVFSCTGDYSDNKRRHLRLANAATLLLVLLIYYLSFAQQAFNPLSTTVNICLLATALLLGYMALRRPVETADTRAG